MIRMVIQVLPAAIAMASDFSNGTSHKKDVDIEAVGRNRKASPSINSSETQHAPVNNLQQPSSSSLSHRHRGHHQPQPHCRSATIFLYATFISLLFIWVFLQISMAHIHLNSSQQSTVLQHMNDEISPDWGSIVSPDQVRRGAVYLLDTLFPSPKLDSSKLTDIPHQRIEQDYVFIFYILLGINILTMLPSWCKYLSGTRGGHVRFTSNNKHGEKTTEVDMQAVIHGKLLRTYLPAYFLATAADWLQGPYKYALYSSYGYTQRDIAHLFVAGYGSGMVLGSIVGGLADSYGRKRLCIGYCLAYTFSVLMKHCKHFYVLLLGRVGGGIATSLLFSVFESWLIGAHGERGLGCKSGLKKEEEEKWLAKSLSVSMYGSSLVAIASGVLANLVVQNSGQMRPLNGNGESLIYVGGYISAFDMCLVPLVLCATLIVCLWEENYGEISTTESSVEMTNCNGHGSKVNGMSQSAGYLKKHSSILQDEESMEENETKLQNEENKQLLTAENVNQRKEGAFSTLYSGMKTVWRSPDILSCCIIGSVFEGAMYIFIFLWTPALTSLQLKLDTLYGNLDDMANIAEKDPHTDSELPFGWIFSSFMVCCMLGTMAFSSLSNVGVPASKCLAGILALASLSCLAMSYPSGIFGVTSANSLQYLGMLMYEFCIGFYYPAMGTVKGTIVPEDQRAAIYNVFRLPLNLLVLVYLVGDFSTEASFLGNAALLMLTCALQIRFVRSSGGVTRSEDNHVRKD